MNWPYFICSGADRESHEDAITTEITEDLQPTKKQLSLPIDIVNSKKVLALRKEQKRKLGKQRSMGSTIDYSPLPIDKHEPEFVSIQHPSPSLQTAERFHRMTSNDCYLIVTPCCLFPKGPCRRKLDGIIQGMKDTSRVMALSLYLPNCDRKGFFKRKQVSLLNSLHCAIRKPATLHCYHVFRLCRFPIIPSTVPFLLVLSQ